MGQQQLLLLRPHEGELQQLLLGPHEGELLQQRWQLCRALSFPLQQPPPLVPR